MLALVAALTIQTIILLSLSRRLERVETAIIMSPQEQADLDALKAESDRLAALVSGLQSDGAAKDASIADLTAKLATAEANAADPAFAAGVAADVAALKAIGAPPAP